MLDASRSTVTFLLEATAHDVHGRFALRSGEIVFDPQTGLAKGRIVIDATSGSTGNDGRDRKMHEDVLQSATYPEIVFVPETLTGAPPAPGEKAAVTLAGKIEIHGATHPLEVPADVEARADGITVHATFRVPYVKWGLDDPSVFIFRVEKYVDVTLELEGVITTPVTSPWPRSFMKPRLDSPHRPC
ncbi:MAG: YceI family protein [Acidobacteria bacterium]|nr:YceI family protein [Acidobacteriota bacterium]